MFKKHYLVFIVLLCVLILGGNLIWSKLTTPSINKQTTLTLYLNQPQLLPDKKTKVTLVETIVPEPQMRDGLSQAKVKIVKNGKTEEVEFKIGGFAGYEAKPVVFSSGIVELVDLKKESAQFKFLLDEK